ncbi:hypothetical protein QTG56_26135 (plasmid) [Rossellomorea sp. AcN35-11]|nr:hypothetical protein [Rossellomorea aquimaris]WJV32097.1 hypothetical protein QTG56_26135 [Rossellomorea sp. AcN35-11]
MEVTISKKLAGNAPLWAESAMYYFQNSMGNQWVATISGDKLYIAGVEFDWEEIILDEDDIYREIELRKLGKKDPGKHYPLSGKVFNDEEKYWLLSVLVAAYEILIFIP